MSFQRQLSLWRVDEVLRRYPCLSITPDADAALFLQGRLPFTASACGLETISDAYDIAIAIPESFPRGFPRVQDVGQRIPRSYHRLTDGSFCLGSPARVRLILADAPTLLGFIEKCVIPYLYGYSFFEKHGHPPFGELAHGDPGLIDDYKRILRVSSVDGCAAMLSLIGRKRRVANKHPCPCGSGHRLGCCHHQTANHLRIKLGRGWCRREADWIWKEYGAAADGDLTMRLRSSMARPHRMRKDSERTTAAPDSSAAAMLEKDASSTGRSE